MGVLLVWTLRADRTIRPNRVVAEALGGVVTTNEAGALGPLDQPCDADVIVAAPGQTGSHFTGRTVMLCRRSAHGALGFVIDQPTAAEAAALYPLPGAIGVGGPIATHRGVLLYLDDDGAQRWTTSHRRARRVSRGLAIDAMLGRAEPADAPTLVFGHAAWGPGQLESELAAGAWLLEAE